LERKLEYASCQPQKKQDPIQGKHTTIDMHKGGQTTAKGHEHWPEKTATFGERTERLRNKKGVPHPTTQLCSTQISIKEKNGHNEHKDRPENGIQRKMEKNATLTRGLFGNTA